MNIVAPVRSKAGIYGIGQPERSANFRTIRATLSGTDGEEGRRGGMYEIRRIEAISRNQLAVAVVIARLRAP